MKTWGSTDRQGERRKAFLDQPAVEEAQAVSKTIVEFYDGEEIWGYSQGYQSESPGFFLFPADPQDNNQKIFVVRSSLVNIQFRYQAFRSNGVRSRSQA